MPETAVADTSTVLHLVEIERCNLLAVFETVTISPHVRAELRRHKALQPAANALLSQLRVRGVAQEEIRHQQELLSAFKLHQADISTAVVAAALRPDVVVTDDLDLRKALESQGQTVAGSIGVLVRALKIGLIDRAEMLEALDRLLDDSSLYTSKAFRARVRSLLGGE